MPQSLPAADHDLRHAPTLLCSTDSAGSSAFAGPPPFASAIPFLPRGARRSYSNRYQSECFRFEEGGDEVWDSDICYYSKGHINQVHHFVDCVINDKPPRYSGEEGVHAVACTLAAIRSAMEDRKVRVSEIGPEFAAYGGSEIQS